jgi:hypothetical protein
MMMQAAKPEEDKPTKGSAWNYAGTFEVRR